MSTTNNPIFPALNYRDADAAIEFLKAAFGFTEHVCYRSDDGVVTHAELKLGDRGMIMLGQYREGGLLDPQRADALASPITIYVVVDEPDAVYAQAVAAGATIVRELEDLSYGSRDFAARDPEGNLWSFGTYDPYTAHAQTETAASA
jgi:uncharacterized glyoxalase superfamily protein PhnB